MSGLRMARVAVLEGRLSNELASLVRRHDGVPYYAPAVREASLDRWEQVGAFIDGLVAGSYSVVVFLTGAGAGALFSAAEGLGRLPELLTALRSVKTVCRGPKPAGMLNRNGVPVSYRAREPYTTTELLEALAGLELAGKGVALVHYGERSATVAEALRARGADLAELFLYEWLLPEDTGALEALVRDLIQGQLDAITFTSQVQARHLFRIAANLGLSDQLLAALKDRTIVASIGPTCSAGLKELGVTPHVVPEHPKMGQLVLALAHYLEPRPPRSRVAVLQPRSV